MSEYEHSALDPTHFIGDLLSPRSEENLTTCDREPIHLSGAIQPHGVLIAVNEENLSVEIASANTRAHLGLDPAQVLDASLHEAIGLGTVERLQGALADPRAAGTDPLACHLAGGVSYDLTWHRIDGMIVVELEPSDLALATLTTSMFSDVRHAMDFLQSASGVLDVCEVAATEIAHLTGYDRVMVYRFHPDGHGEVVAEQCDPAMAPFMGLHYPASDIPRQARKLYLLNQLRVIADIDYEPVPLLSIPGRQHDPIDLSSAGLRSVSPMHLAYLANMGVQATLTISLMHGTQLWGMLACHHRTPKGIDAQMRAACRMLGQVISSQIVAQENNERHAYRHQLAEVEIGLISLLSGADSLAGALVGTNSSLSLTAADGMVARLDGETVTAGVVPPSFAVEDLLGKLRSGELITEMICDDLPLQIPEFAELADDASGVLALPLSGAYEDFILWFRGEAVREMTWAGDPDKPMTGDPLADAHQLGPRESFAAFVQQVHGRSRPWLPAEIEGARGLGAAIRELLFARSRDRFAHLALHDTLTGLPNRALLLDRIAQALSRQQRKGTNVALLFVDLDHFKLVNDSIGHAAGDTLLCQVARRLSATIRDSDTAARMGGDEFVILCEAIAPGVLRSLSDRIVQEFRLPFLIDEEEFLVTTSIGIALADPDSTPTELLRRADTAMYRVKNSGRNAAAPAFPFPMENL